MFMPDNFPANTIKIRFMESLLPTTVTIKH